MDELIGALPAMVAGPLLDPLEWMGWDRAPVTISFSDATRWGVRRLKIEAALKALAAVFDPLCQGANLGRTLVAHDRPAA